EVASKPLQLNKLYEEFFKNDEKSKYDDYCNALTKYNTQHKGTQDLCVKLVRFVKKIAEWKNKQESYKYCNYLQYWLYDEIKGIYKEHTKKFGEIPFSKELIEIANKVNKEIKKNDCTLKHEKEVTLDELIKRKFSHIYLKKYDEIKQNVDAKVDVKAAGVGGDKGAQGPSKNLAANVNTKEVLSPAPKEIPGKGALSVPSYNSGIRTDTVPVPVVDSAGPLESVSDKVDSNFYRNIIMAAAILGTIFFLFYYNMSSGLKSRFPKRKRKKKIFEHNYYEEYEKELAKYESENESLDSQSDRYYLNYQPEGDYDY
ncbi:hypothetical protein PVNG_05351, partial [Plasmodium vivax North Korean]